MKSPSAAFRGGGGFDAGNRTQSYRELAAARGSGKVLTLNHRAIGPQDFARFPLRWKVLPERALIWAGAIWSDVHVGNLGCSCRLSFVMEKHPHLCGQPRSMVTALGSGALLPFKILGTR